MITQSHEVRDWLMQQPETYSLEVSEIAHVHKCISHLIDWYYQGKPVGSFLTAVLRNDLTSAVYAADGINIRALPIYIHFIYNHLPINYRNKVKGMCTNAHTR